MVTRGASKRPRSQQGSGPAQDLQPGDSAGAAGPSQDISEQNPERIAPPPETTSVPVELLQRLLARLESLERRIESSEPLPARPRTPPAQPTTTAEATTQHGERRDTTRPSQSPPRKIKPKDPTIFTGKNPREHEMWRQDCEHAFDLAASIFADEDHKVDWAVQFLAGIAKEAWYEIKLRRPPNYTFGQFQADLLDAIFPRTLRTREARQKYQDAKQRADQPVIAFAQYLTSLEHELNSIPSEEERIARLYTGLRTDLQDILKISSRDYSTRAELIAHAASLERTNLAIRQAPHRGSNSSTQGQPKRGARQGQSSRRAEPRDNHGTSTPTPDRSNIECYNCHKKGHIAKDCWSKKPDTSQNTNPNTHPIGAVRSKNPRRPR
jgi:hypothetical protein